MNANSGDKMALRRRAIASQRACDKESIGRINRPTPDGTKCHITPGVGPTQHTVNVQCNLHPHPMFRSRQGPMHGPQDWEGLAHDIASRADLDSTVPPFSGLNL